MVKECTGGTALQPYGPLSSKMIDESEVNMQVALFSDILQAGFIWEVFNQVIQADYPVTRTGIHRSAIRYCGLKATVPDFPGVLHQRLAVLICPLCTAISSRHHRFKRVTIWHLVEEQLIHL